MSNLSFTDVKSVIKYNSNSNDKGYTFPMLPKYNATIGNLQQSQVHIISGLPSAGVTSFIDQNYVLSVLLQWYNTDPSERNPLKIFYYSLKDSELKKLQSLLCNYLKLVDNLKTDIPTLNSQAGKLYDIANDLDLNNAIENATDFFDEIIEDEILIVKAGQVNPSGIYNDIQDYMSSISDNSSVDLHRKAGHEKELILVVVDSVDYFLTDEDGYGRITGDALHEKFQSYIKGLKFTYGISAVIAVPSNLGYIRTPKDTEPHYRHLGSYGGLADKGICIYNPIAEKNIKFYNGDADLYTSPRGSVLMRTWHIVRNTDGIESINDRLFLLPGTSYMIEHSYKNQINDLDDVLDILIEKSSFSD